MFHGFVRAANGTITSFDVPGASQGIFALSINPMGAITGYYTDASGVNHGFLRTRKPIPAHDTDLNQAEDACPFEAVNGVPIAVKEEALESRKENRLWRFGWN